MDDNGLLIFAAIGMAFYAWSSYARTPPQVEGTATAASGKVVAGLDATKPRGVRNNNPGNIKWSAGNNWVGQVGKDAAGFVVFDTPAHGLRAMAKLLKTYYNTYKLHTLLDITKRWSPDAIGLSGAYAAAVGKWINLAPTAQISLSAVNLAAVMRGMIAQENGQAYLDYYPTATLTAAATAT